MASLNWYKTKLPQTEATRVLTGSVSTAGAQTVLAATEVLGYAWVSVQTAGGSYNISVQFSNDNTNWVTARLVAPSFAASNAMQPSATLDALWTTPVVGRYLRIIDTHVSGTTAVTVVLSTAAVASNWISVDTELSTAITPADGMAANFTAPVATYDLVYNGSTWDRRRVSNLVKTVTATAAGSTALWTPATGKKVRLMRLLLQVSGNAATAGGAVLTLDLRDATTTTGLTFDAYVPAAAGTAAAWSSGWVELGNGVLSATANNILNLNLSATLSAGSVRAVACGTEE